MNQTLEQYRSSRHGLLLDYRDKFSEQIITILSQYVPDDEQATVSETIRNYRREMYDLLDRDEHADRYERTYLDKINSHIQRKEEYVAVTP